MTRRQRLAGALMTVLSGIAVYCFFAFRYPYHLHFQEQYQLFEFTWDYFRSVVAVPGGLADWTGRFLTQFCYYAPAGALVMALLLCVAQLATWAVCRLRTLPVYALSFLPAVALMVFCCDENALLGGVVALVLALGCVALCARLRPDGMRHVLEAVLVPVLYLACGPLAVVFVVVSIIGEFSRRGTRAWLVAAVLFVLAGICPLLAGRLFPYPPGRLFFGVHYYRYHNVLPVPLWVAASCAVLVPLLSDLKGKLLSGGLSVGAGAFAAVAVLTVLLTFRAADASKEEWMRYDFMVRMQMWNRLMMAADVRNPGSARAVSCLNLALAKTGRLADSQFQYAQCGPEGLLPDFVGDYMNPLTTGEIYWHLGMVNTAQRYAFEAQEAIPDFQKSARCYQRLVQTNIVNGDWDVARKYLKALGHTLFYRKWARETAALLDSGQIFARQNDLARARDWRFQMRDFLFSETEMDSMLGLLKVDRPQNTMALEYLMAWCLLRKDLDRFAECITLVDAPVMPKSYQEALLLKWVQTHTSFDGLPAYLSRVYVQRISGFMADLQAGKPEADLRRDYGDTYWLYYYRYGTLED